MKKLLFLSAILFIAVCSSLSAAPSLVTANRLYAAGDYREAAAAYERVLTTHYNADAYYNLGNAYYRMGNMPRAILNYERAYLLNPMNSDIRYNLALARSKASVQASGEGGNFLADIAHSAVYLLGAAGWQVLSLVAFAVGVAAFLLFYFGRSLRARKVSFFVMVLMLVSVAGGQAALALQRYNLSHRNHAIVLRSTPLSETPSAASAKSAEPSAKRIELKGGEKVKIIDNSMKQWVQVQLPDGRSGWGARANMELI